jgi:phage baseplate assembly protein W
MSTYNFKSVGKTKDQEKTENEATQGSLIPYGIKTPLKISQSDGLFELNFDLAEQFADNLRNLLLTNWGERLGQYDFGANLKPLTTEFVSQENFDNEAISRIQSAVNRWMPFIDLENFSSTIDRMENKNTAIVRVNITYNIPALSVYNKGIQITLYVI